MKETSRKDKPSCEKTENTDRAGRKTASAADLLTTIRRPKAGLNANALKLIAILAMTADHLAWALFPGYPRQPLPLLLHLIGRITCPIMCYFIAEGFHYTRNVNKYTARLAVMAVISHFAYIFGSYQYVDAFSFIPFYYGSFLNQTSVIWSLLGGLLLLRIDASERLSPLAKSLLTALVCIVTFPSDWSCIAALCIFAIGTNRGEPKKQLGWSLFFVSFYVLVYCVAMDVVYGLLQFGVLLAVPFLHLYNGSRGRSVRGNRIMKWLFYLYYPLHLFVIGLMIQLLARK